MIKNKELLQEKERIENLPPFLSCSYNGTIKSIKLYSKEFLNENSIIYDIKHMYNYIA